MADVPQSCTGIMRELAYLIEAHTNNPVRTYICPLCCLLLRNAE